MQFGLKFEKSAILVQWAWSYEPQKWLRYCSESDQNFQYQILALDLVRRYQNENSQMNFWAESETKRPGSMDKILTNRFEMISKFMYLSRYFCLFDIQNRHLMNNDGWCLSVVYQILILLRFTYHMMLDQNSNICRMNAGSKSQSICTFIVQCTK